MNLRLFPAEKPWTTAVGPWRAVAAMVMILGVTLCVGFLPEGFSAAWRSLTCSVLEVVGSLLAWLLVLPPGFSGGGRCGILGAERPRARHHRWIAVAPLLIWCGSAVLGAAWGGILRRLGLSVEELQPMITHVRDFTILEFVMVLLAVGVLTPIAEEFFFRRLLFGVLEPLGVGAAAVLTATLFAAGHGFLYGFPGLFWMGLIFQLVYCRCRDLAAPILVHATVNCVALAGGRAGWF